MLYGWLWRRLPGPGRCGCCWPSSCWPGRRGRPVPVALPAVAPLMPFNDNTVGPPPRLPAGPPASSVTQ